MSGTPPCAMACVHLPALSLQIAHRRQDLHASSPGVVCQGIFVAWPNRAAKQAGIQPGMRVSQARSLSPMLQTATVSAAEEQQATQEIWQHLLHFSPAVEIDAGHSGVLWLDPNGLRHLFGTPMQWGEAIRAALRKHRYHATVGVGFNRYLTFALATQKHTCFVCEDADQEAALAHALPIAHAPLPTCVHEALVLLGVARLGDFLGMPEQEVQQCLGDEAARIHRLAHRRTWAPLAPQAWVPPNEVEQLIEPADDDAHRLLFVIKNMLQPMLDKLRDACQACVGVHLQMRIDKTSSHLEHIAPATPTLDIRKITDLLRLRLAYAKLPGPICCIILRLESRGMRPEQMQMLLQKPKRDLRAATWALAKIRALMGEDAVTHARLCDSHLPESSFCWDLLSDVALPTAQATQDAPFPLIRAVPPVRAPLPPPPRRNIQQWLRGEGRIESMHGPYRLHTSWWLHPKERDYYYITTDKQKVLWVYYSRLEQRWFCLGCLN